ncbi:tyrosine-type recombinase/integrase [Pseudonocardia tropica]|uniref:Tyrosine-type recombinase/integrase n=1 Tax=Pseudonocardia tropica TaxID=681289 RepID=A0ABV1JUG3_9PSEU
MSSIRKRPNGAWRARYRDPDGREHARHFARKVDAQTWLDEATAAIVTGQYASPAAGRVTLGEFYRPWAARQVWAPGTAKAVDLAVRDSGLDGVALGTLRRSHIEAWVKRMDGRGLAASTIRTRVTNLRVVLRAAVRDRVIPSDPADGVTLPRRRRRDAAMTIPTPAEVGAMLAAAGPFAVAVALAAFAGLRVGEICGLQVGDVAFLTRAIRVRRQVQRAGGGEASVRAPKAASERDVHAPDELMALLGRHVGEHRPGSDPARWLLVTDDGRPLTQDTARHLWDATRAAAEEARVAALRPGADSGMPLSGHRFHDLRHYYASGLIASGCDVVTVQRALGHASPTITLSTYAHLWPSAEDRTRTAAAGLMTAALAAGEARADSLRTGEA